jgi:hypothetical protein
MQTGGGDEHLDDAVEHLTDCVRARLSQTARERAPDDAHDLFVLRTRSVRVADAGLCVAAEPARAVPRTHFIPPRAPCAQSGPPAPRLPRLPGLHLRVGGHTPRGAHSQGGQLVELGRVLERALGARSPPAQRARAARSGHRRPPCPRRMERACRRPRGSRTPRPGRRGADCGRVVTRAVRPRVYAAAGARARMPILTLTLTPTLATYCTLCSQPRACAVRARRP